MSTSAVAPPPYKAIARGLRNGRVIPFLGAGVNMSARKPDEQWSDDDDVADFLPSGRELAQFLAAEVSITDEREMEDLAKIASYMTISVGRDSLRSNLRGIFNKKTYRLTNVHEYLASEALRYDDGKAARLDMSKSGRDEKAGPRDFTGSPLLIVTTNYDDLMERALQDRNCPYDLVIYPCDNPAYKNAVFWWKDHGHRQSEPEKPPPNDIFIELDRTNVVYKMHGSVYLQEEWESYVITEEDYIEFLARMTYQSAIPKTFMRYFQNHQFLFLGYGLKDWNLRMVLRNLHTTLTEDRPSWAVQSEPSFLERELWGKRQVIIYDKDIKEFIDNLQKASLKLKPNKGSI